MVYIEDICIKMLKKINDNDQKMIHQWRNHPEVRSVMFSDHEISWD